MPKVPLRINSAEAEIQAAAKLWAVTLLYIRGNASLQAIYLENLEISPTLRVSLRRPDHAIGKEFRNRFTRFILRLNAGRQPR
jgi:hypothetical protein